MLYWPKTLNQLIEDPALISLTREKNFTNLNLTSSHFTMELTVTDNLDPNIIYYLVSILKDSANTLWEVSNELCFRLKDRLYWTWDECGSVHAAWADMRLANISHTIDGNKVTLSWIAVNGSNTVDLFLRDDKEETFNKLTTINMSAESYTFTLTRDWEYIVKFIPNNWWTEVNYTFNYLAEKKADEPTIPKPIKPVVVWPKENILAVIIWTILLYLVYKIVRRKA